MATTVRSYSKMNLGLAVGPLRRDGFHCLVTLYQTLELHDLVEVSARLAERTQIVLEADHAGVPRTATGNAEKNTAYQMVEKSLGRLGLTAQVNVKITKRLPVQGGMGAGSANAAAALLGLERELGVELSLEQRLEVAAEVGSDVPLFLLGGSVLGVGRGEQVTGYRDLPSMSCVVATPGVGVSTKEAFRVLDARFGGVKGDSGRGLEAERYRGLCTPSSKLAGDPVSAASARSADSGRDHDTEVGGVAAAGGEGVVPSPLTSGPFVDKLEQLSRAYADALRAFPVDREPTGIARTAASESEPNQSSRGEEDGIASDLAEKTFLALVRTGMENDFEEVVFSQHPSLRDLKRELMGSDSGQPAVYAALSGSGSALFGLYRTEADAVAAQRRVQKTGTQAILTRTLPRPEYWARMFVD